MTLVPISIKRYNFAKRVEFLESHFFPESISIPHDDLPVSTVEPWVKQKVLSIRQLIVSFISSLPETVDEIVFVDLFAGNGLYSLGVKSDIFSGISLMTLQGELPINKYVLCESDPDQFSVLKIRVNKYFKDKNVVLLNGKPQDLVEKIKMYVPSSKRNYKVAVIGVADSFLLEPGLETFHNLALHGFNFIIPVTFHLGEIDHKFYLGNGRDRLKSFLGYIAEPEKNWKPDNNEIFYRQLVNIWKGRLQNMGLTVSSAAQKLDSGLMEIPSYQLCMVSSRYPVRSIHLSAITGNHTQFNLFNQN